MPYDVLVAEEFWRRLKKTRDRALGEKLVKSLGKLKESPRERGRVLVGVEHPRHGRIYRLRAGTYRILYCVAEAEGRVYVLTFGPRARVYDEL